MSRIPTPASIEAAPAAAQPLLQAVKKQLGVVPNLFRLIATSPAALEGYLGLNGALAKGALDAATRERIALAVAEFNGCDYCLSAHSYLGKNLAKLRTPRSPPIATAARPTRRPTPRWASPSSSSTRAAMSRTRTCAPSGTLATPTPR